MQSQSVPKLNWVRQAHRWLSILFTTIVLGIFIMLGLGKEPLQWVYFLPLPPLFLMMATGLYMFVAPYTRMRTDGGSEGANAQ
jgi:membrane protein CcdC involved in cytochrome C biogenesis